MRLVHIKAVLAGPITPRLSLGLARHRRTWAVGIASALVAAGLCVPVCLFIADWRSHFFRTVYDYEKGTVRFGIQPPPFWEAMLEQLGIVLAPYLAWILLLVLIHWWLARGAHLQKRTALRWALGFPVAFTLAWALPVSMRRIHWAGFFGVQYLRDLQLGGHHQWWWFTYWAKYLLLGTGILLVLVGLFNNYRVCRALRRSLDESQAHKALLQGRGQVVARAMAIGVWLGAIAVLGILVAVYLFPDESFRRCRSKRREWMRRHTPPIAVQYYVQDTGGNWPRSISDLQERGYLRALPETGMYAVPESVIVQGKKLPARRTTPVDANFVRETVNFRASLQDLYVDGDILRDRRNGEPVYLIRFCDSSGTLMSGRSMWSSVLLFEWALSCRKSTTAPGTTTRPRTARARGGGIDSVHEAPRE